MSDKPGDLKSTQVLLIDPDPLARQMLVETLYRWGHVVTTGDESALGNPHLTTRAELLLLDPSGPGGRAWPLLRTLRERSRLPIVVMLSGDDTFDRVLALESGADAIIAKPVDVRELRARMLGLLSRDAVAPAAPTAAVPASAVRFGRWILDPATRRLNGPGGFSTPLAPAEYRLLRAFLDRPRSVLRRQDLMDLARGTGEQSLERNIDLLISRLRHKLDDDARNPHLIRTVRGIGYLFDDSLR